MDFEFAGDLRIFVVYIKRKAMLTTIIILAVLLVVMGIIVLIGKGDNLIAGYNTASKEERAQYDVKKLRLLVGGCSILVAPTLFILVGEPSTAGMAAFACIVLVLCFLVVFLCNTWAKKKSK
jgi:hypothetical protein